MAGAVLAGCHVARHETAGADGRVLHVGNGAEPQDLDPHLVTGVPEHRLVSALFEGLVDVDPETLEPVPAVAESWTVSSHGTVYTFRLREDARWSNGDPVRAHDFVYAWKRILTPALGSEYAYMLHCMKNARAYNEGTLTDFGEVGAKALDDRTLEVTLNHPTPYFLSMQIHYTWYPVHRATIERYGQMDERGTRWTRAGNLVGNGAFRLERWEPDRIITIARNPHYWNAGRVRLEAVHFHPVDNVLTEELLFRVGRFDLTTTVPLNKVEVYQRTRPDAIRIDPYLGTYFYRLNVTRPPFTDARVRRAFAMSIDREDLVRNVVRAGRKPAYCFTPPDTAGYTCSTAIPYDVDEARRLLAEAGYPNGEGFPEVELLHNTSDDHRQIAEAAQAMWKQHLNVRVSLVNQEWKVYLNSMLQRDYQIARSGWIGDFVDPINFLECFTTGNGNNRTGFASDKYDALIAQALGEVDGERRIAVLQEAERLLLEEAPIVPIYFYTNIFLKHPDLKGISPNLLGYVSFKRLYFEPDGAPPREPRGEGTVTRAGVGVGVTRDGRAG